VNQEIKRRARVVGILPNDAAVNRLLGAVPADMHDEWQSLDRRYLSAGSMALLTPNGGSRGFSGRAYRNIQRGASGFGGLGELAAPTERL
jgi:hypothetical protein